ncbi:type II toxin-antitoxin system RelE/ParE family toxin [Clostridium lacusfryxellense]|uniref:type II toxin-antitoxin system RelE/ParE family toxin n=1 Tax=Clostridium lacusfryxellense TaxID=205328 RepID=UPI001C0E0E3D|nr:type II toxin-antitoxin system RelE/ParE family toxin [Clostridium lacusfryxellense]MBU3112569.1 type II toxin-antitoxin system RelE/ParE family toxin [Clostridium lacusfryxellense]
MQINEYKVKFTPVAEDDLDQIYEYIVNKLFAETAASRLMEKIETGIMRLGQFPFSCSHVLDEALKIRGYRKFIVDNYIVFNLVNETEKQVVIMRILYGARDYENLM